MDDREIINSVESILEGRSEETKKIIIDFFEQRLQEEQQPQDNEQENRFVQATLNLQQPLPLSAVPEPSTRVKHILKIQTDLEDAEETLRWLIEFNKTRNLDKFHGYIDYFLEFVIKNLTKEDAVYIIRKAILDHNLPFMPTKLFNFNEFHKQFGKYVASDEFHEQFLNK